MSHIRENSIEVIQTDHDYSKKTVRSILPDLIEYNQFSEDIKNRANAIYMQMKHNTKRAKKRKLLLFFCVYSAYKELGINVNPSDLGHIFNLSSGELQKTESMFSHLQTGYKPVCNVRTIYDYISDYCIKIGMEEFIPNITLLCQTILLKNKDLSQASCQPAAAGMIKYYMTINGIELSNKNALAEAADRSDTTVECMYKRICAVDNA
jgi:hypothetical protein